jgi:hypothetical protein
MKILLRSDKDQSGAVSLDNESLSEPMSQRQRDYDQREVVPLLRGSTYAAGVEREVVPLL